MEQAIRKELGISDRELTAEDMEGLISLYPQQGTEKIKSLKGLEHAVNLEQLFLPGQAIKDLTPLSWLWKLNFLALNSNEIEDVCPLRSLYSLEKLVISNNRITSIDCLAGMWGLTDLLAGNNRVEDITALVHLPLTWVNLENNLISDLSPLEGHPDLENLYLANNRIEDIRVLTSLPALENVHLQGNPLKSGAQQAIEELEGLGIRVNPSSEEQLLNPMKVYVDGEKVRFSLPPVNEKGTTLVQFRPLFEKLGLTVGWEEETRKVTGQKEGTRIVLQIGEKFARVNDKYKYLEQAPRIINGSTFVPARFVAETLGYSVSYDRVSNSVWIDTGPKVFTTYDGRGHFELGDGWNLEVSTGDLDGHASKGGSRLYLATAMKGYGDESLGLDEFLELYRDRLTQQNATVTQEAEHIDVNGHPAATLRFTHALDSDNVVMYTATLLEGQENIYILFLATPEGLHELYLPDYERVLGTYKLLEAREDKLKSQYGSMSAEERVKDAVAYYRGAGFFAENSREGLVQLQEKVLSWLKESYEWNEADEWFPFGKDSLYQDIADVFILEYDPERVWIRDMEMDVLAGNDMYVQTLKEWAAISRGAFKPEDIEEFWKTEEGPVTVRFRLNGEQETVYPFANSDWLDYSILDRINGMIEDTGMEFVVVHIDQSIFVTVLTQEEKKKLQEERLMEFEELDGY